MTESPTFDPTRPFTRAQARAAGLRIPELRGSRFQKVFFDLYVSASVAVTPQVRARAALDVSPAGAYVSHYTAAELWGGCVPDQPDTHVCVPSGNRSERRGIRAHAALRSSALTERGGLSITTPEQTFVDLGRCLTLVDLVVLGDSLVSAGHTSPGDLVRAAEAHRGAGARLARRAASYVRAGVDSPMETRLRMLIVLAGLPEPVVDFHWFDESGRLVMRFDLSYPILKLIVEYDGRQHAESDAQWGRDVDRRELLDQLGWRIVIVRAKDIYRDPGRTLDRIAQALRSRGANDLPGKLSPEWRRHFPGR